MTSIHDIADVNDTETQEVTKKNSDAELPVLKAKISGKYSTYVDLIKQKVVKKVKSQAYLPEAELISDLAVQSKNKVQLGEQTHHTFYLQPKIDFKEESLSKDFPLLKDSSSRKSLANITGIKQHFSDYSEKLKSEIKDQSGVWYSEDSILPEVFTVLLARIRTDFKYSPKLSLESMATLTIESRTRLRNFNRNHTEWAQNYCSTSNGQKSVPNMIIQNFEAMIKYYQVSLENMYAAITTRNLIKIIFDIQTCIVELLELGVWSAIQCKILIVVQQKMCQIFELDYEINSHANKSEFQLPYYISQRHLLRQIVVSRCKILSHTWMVLLDEAEEHELQTKAYKVHFQRILSSQIGLYKILQACMDKQQDFNTKKDLDSCLNDEQVIKEFQRQEQKYRPKYLHIPWNLERIRDLDFNFDRDYFATEETINYHLTQMLKITAMGGSQFLVENIVFASIQYSILDRNSQNPVSSGEQNQKLSEKISLREKIENWCYKFHTKKSTALFTELEWLIGQLLINSEMSFEEFAEHSMHNYLSGLVKSIMVVLSLISQDGKLKQLIGKSLEALANISQNNPLAISQILSDKFAQVRADLDEHNKLAWSLTWLRILKKSQYDELFSMSAYQWIQLTQYLTSLQNYSLDLKWEEAQISLKSIEFYYERQLHAVIMAQIYKQLLIKGENCKQQIWMKCHLFKTEQSFSRAATILEEEVLSLEQRFENIYRAHEEILVEKIQKAFFFVNDDGANWGQVVEECLAFEHNPELNLKKIDPWIISEIVDLRELQIEIDSCAKIFEKWVAKKNSVSGLELKKWMRILQVLGLAIASDCMHLLGCNEYSTNLTGVFKEILKSDRLFKEDSPYLESTFRLLFHLVNNSIDSGWCPHVLSIYETICSLLLTLTADRGQGSTQSKMESTQTGWSINFLNQQKTKYEKQILMPYIIYLLHGAPQTSEEQIQKIHAALYPPKQSQNQPIDIEFSEELSQERKRSIQVLLDKHIKLEYPQVAEANTFSGSSRTQDHYQQPLRVQTRQNFNRIPYMHNWLNFDPTKDICKRLLMDRSFHKSFHISERRTETFQKFFAVNQYEGIAKKLSLLRDLFECEKNDHPAKSYFSQNKRHFAVYIERILKLNLSCYTHDHRKRVFETLHYLNAIQKMCIIGQQFEVNSFQNKMKFIECGCLQESVENNFLKVSGQSMAVFDPQFYRRLLVDAITTKKEARLIIFTLALPSAQLMSDEQSEKLLEMRKQHLEDNFDKITAYFDVIPKEGSQIEQGEEQGDALDKAGILETLFKPIYDFTVSLELLQSQKNTQKSNPYAIHQRKSYEIRTLERILIEDDCKFVKQFWGRLCESYDAVVYRKTADGSKLQKIREKFSRPQPIFSHIKRLIESNTYLPRGEVGFSLSELKGDSNKLKNGIWDSISAKNTFECRQDLICLRTDLQLINEFFSGQEFSTEVKKLLQEIVDFRERKILWQLKNAVLYLDWSLLLEPNPFVSEGSEKHLLPLSLSEISTAKLVENSVGTYLKPSDELVKLSNLIMTDFMDLLTTITQIGTNETDKTVAMGMMFDFDEVFNQKSLELLKYGLKIPSEEYDSVDSDQLLKAYIRNPEEDQDEGLWLLFRKCFQLVELVLKMRDRILNTNQMKPILNGLLIIQQNSQNLANQDCQISQQDSPFSKLTPYAKSNLKFICSVMKKVEISIELSNNSLRENSDGERCNKIAYFFRYPETFYLDSSTKQKFMKSIDVDNPRYEIVKNMPLFKREMSLNFSLEQQNPLMFQLVTNDKMQLFQLISWVIGLILNVGIVSTYVLNELDEEGKEIDKGDRRLTGGIWEKRINLASFAFTIWNGLLAILWLMFKLNIEFEIRKEDFFLRNPSHDEGNLSMTVRLQILFQETLFKSKHTVSFILHAFFGLLGPLLDPLFHTFHLLLWFNISEAAMYILDATTKRMNTLFQTLIVTIFLVYSYSSITANYYSDKFAEDAGEMDVCKSLASCFFYSLNHGVRNGITDSMSPYEYGKDSKYPLKVVFDLSYFILINTIILNIVFGIIVDTFGDMRDEQFRRDEIIENTCLICMNEQKDILESKVNYAQHIKHQHNIWDYVYFFSYISHKPVFDLTLPETEAYENISKNKHDWLPLKKSLFLKKIKIEDEDSDGGLEAIISKLEEIDNNFNERLKSIESLIRKVSDSVC